MTCACVYTYDIYIYIHRNGMRDRLMALEGERERESGSSGLSPTALQCG